MKGSYSPFSMLLLSAMTFAWHSADAQNTRIAMSAIAPHTGLKVDQYAINASRFSGKSEAVGSARNKGCSLARPISAMGPVQA